MWKGGKLPARTARGLITTDTAPDLVRQVVCRSLSVRETEDLVRKSAISPEKRKALRRRDEKDADTRALEADLSANLKMGVHIDHMPGGEGGKLTISYRTLDDLDLLCRVLSAIPRDVSI